jgi:hypothetical protein
MNIHIDQWNRKNIKKFIKTKHIYKCLCPLRSMEKVAYPRRGVERAKSEVSILKSCSLLISFLSAKYILDRSNIQMKKLKPLSY